MAWLFALLAADVGRDLAEDIGRDLADGGRALAEGGALSWLVWPSSILIAPCDLPDLTLAEPSRDSIDSSELEENADFLLSETGGFLSNLDDDFSIAVFLKNIDTLLNNLFLKSQNYTCYLSNTYVIWGIFDSRLLQTDRNM